MSIERITNPEQIHEDSIEDRGLRPRSLQEFTGQETLKESLSIALSAAKMREEAVDHCLLAGPPGLGKTTLAAIIAQEMDTQLHITSGPVLEKPSDLAGILTSLQAGEVLFIDEIHRLNRSIEEYLYVAMEDFRLDIMIDSGPAARGVNITLQPFTLVGATPRAGMLSAPVRDRFGLQFRLEMYNPQELAQILGRSAGILDVSLQSDAAELLAARSRGTPRIANRVLRRCRDVAQVVGDSVVTVKVANKTLDMLGIDEHGLDLMDRTILETLIDKFNGGPVGLSTIGAAIGEEASTIEEVYEPYLIQQGFLARTQRGRVATVRAYQKLHRTVPKSHQDLQEELLF